MNGSPSSTARRLRLAAVIVAAVCVLALAAGTFVVSYPGIRGAALAAGVTASLARIYPGIFDAVLLVAWVAAFSPRGALRGYAWLVIIVVSATVAAADVAHSMSVALPRRPMQATAAIVPWAVLLIGFTLLYAMARQGWPGRKPSAQPAPGDLPAAGPGAPAASRSGAVAENGTTKVPLSALLAGKPATAAGQDQDQAADQARPS